MRYICVWLCTVAGFGILNKTTEWKLLVGNQTENNPAFDLVCGVVLIQAFIILRDQI